ncbi:hypothetical protein DXG01_011039, partial [Tephrocybe rancida]
STFCFLHHSADTASDLLDTLDTLRHTETHQDTFRNRFQTIMGGPGNSKSKPAKKKSKPALPAATSPVTTSPASSSMVNTHQNTPIAPPATPTPQPMQPAWSPAEFSSLMEMINSAELDFITGFLLSLPKNTEGILFNTIWCHAYKEGVSSGRNEGYKAGEDVGFLEGKEAGTDIGWRVGRDEGLEEGFDKGKEAGYKEGWFAGVAEGKEMQMKKDYCDNSTQMAPMTASIDIMVQTTLTTSPNIDMNITAPAPPHAVVDNSIQTDSPMLSWADDTEEFVVELEKPVISTSMQLTPHDLSSLQTSVLRSGCSDQKRPQPDCNCNCKRPDFRLQLLPLQIGPWHIQIGQELREL